MKLYEMARAPNPRRVRIYLAEKKLTVPTVQIDLMKGEHRQPEFLERNPWGLVPVLELEDGTPLAESMAICRYFEELHPEPPLFGRSAKEKALIEMYNRQAESHLFLNVAYTFRHTNPNFANYETQIPAWGDLSRSRAVAALTEFDRQLASRRFFAGDSYSIADITALCGVDFCRAARIEIPVSLGNIKRWHAEMTARPSASA
jgi:glutathione S-transferase